MLRFIPAYAGNTNCSGVYLTLKSVHPRLRGEHTFLETARGDMRGSSPPTRGTHPHLSQLSRLLRFIPAYAGNTFFYIPKGSPPPVHPRLRGEHIPTGAVSGIVVGSSPPTRGTHRRPLGGGKEDRFIPAYAGNTGTMAGARSSSAVHPRLRGEHRVKVGQCSSSNGSSPPTRGTPS